METKLILLRCITDANVHKYSIIPFGSGPHFMLNLNAFSINFFNAFCVWYKLCINLTFDFLNYEEKLLMFRCQFCSREKILLQGSVNWTNQFSDSAILNCRAEKKKIQCMWMQTLRWPQEFVIFAKICLWCLGFSYQFSLELNPALHCLLRSPARPILTQ